MAARGRHRHQLRASAIYERHLVPSIPPVAACPFSLVIVYWSFLVPVLTLRQPLRLPNARFIRRTLFQASSWVRMFLVSWESPAAPGGDV